MKPDWDKLADTYKSAGKIIIADVDCTVHNDLCGKHGVKGFPTVKVFKAKGPKSGEPYNGGRDFNSLKGFVEKNFNTGPACSLEAKNECSKEDLAILEESEKMSPADRKAKIKAVEQEILDKKMQAKQLEVEWKKLGESLHLIKAAGEKPDIVRQVLNEDELNDNCEGRVCVLAFLPHILEGGAKERNRLLKIIDSVFKETKADGKPVGFMWLQGGDQFEIEEKLALQFGFPAVIAVHFGKKKYGVHRGTFDHDSLKGFISAMTIGRVPLQDIPKGMPKWPKIKAWDGKDGEMPSEEEL